MRRPGHDGQKPRPLQLKLGKRCALKALPAEAARFDMAARLRNEGRALARLAHPDIVAVSDAGTTPDRLPVFVTESLDGETLRARLEREERLRAGDAIGIAAAVASALGAAHRIGVVHRDVKLESLFLARGGRVELLDFGMAKLHSGPSKLTARGVTVGTPRYMAPEQALGARVDQRADWGWCCSRHAGKHGPARRRTRVLPPGDPTEPVRQHAAVGAVAGPRAAGPRVDR